MTLDEVAKAAPLARESSVPDWLMGIWRRRSITFADGSEDDTTRVVWVQAGDLTGDIRVPADRPDVSHRKSLADCTREELAALAAAEGGVAESRFKDGVMRWDGWSAFQPLNNWPEPGELRRVGGCMIEFAPSGAYVEDWRFEPASGPLRAALRLLGEHAGDGRITPRAGGLVVTGDVAVLSLGRTSPLPARPLPALFGEAEDPAAVAAAAFEAVTSLARGGEIVLSTNPFLEGAPLSLGDFAPGADAGALEETLADRVRVWRVHALAA